MKLDRVLCEDIIGDGTLNKFIDVEAPSVGETEILYVRHLRTCRLYADQCTIWPGLSLT